MQTEKNLGVTVYGPTGRVERRHGVGVAVELLTYLDRVWPTTARYAFTAGSPVSVLDDAATVDAFLAATAGGAA
jgi:hypothetical protein